MTNPPGYPLPQRTHIFTILTNWCTRKTVTELRCMIEEKTWLLSLAHTAKNIHSQTPNTWYRTHLTTVFLRTLWKDDCILKFPSIWKAMEKNSIWFCVSYHSTLSEKSGDFRRRIWSCQPSHVHWGLLSTRNKYSPWLSLQRQALWGEKNRGEVKGQAYPDANCSQSQTSWMNS